MKRYNTIILGAGASALMFATHQRHHNMLMIDTNLSIGAKIKISGGGRCNVTNRSVSSSNFVSSSSRSIEPILEHFTQLDLLEFLNSNGVYPKIRTDGQYFCTKSSDEIINMFKKLTSHVDLSLGTKILEVEKIDGEFVVTTTGGKFGAKRVVVATGGLSYTKIGASDIGLQIAAKLGHTIVVTKPALVGLTLQPPQFWFKELSGISMRVALKVKEKSFEGDLLFAHKGITGPVVLNGSLYWERGEIVLDFLPKLNIVKMLKGSKKQLSTLLPVSKRFAKEFLKSIDLDDKSANRLSSSEIERLKLIHNYSFAPSGTFGYTKAETTKGGVSLDELDLDSMQSLFVDGLYFIGEVTDVAGELGGYNLQWAFSSAYLCAKSMA